MSSIRDSLLQQFPELEQLRVREVVVDKINKKINCTLSYPNANVALDMPLRRSIFQAVKNCVPQGYYCTTTIKNDTFNAISFKQFVKDTIVSKFLALADIDKDNIIVQQTEGKMLFEVTLLLNDVQIKTAEACNFEQNFRQYLATISYYDCHITIQKSQNQIDIAKIVQSQQKLSDMAVARELLKPVRRFVITDVAPYIGKLVVTSPMYILDVREPKTSCTLCGVISDKSIKQTKNASLGLVKFTLKDKSKDIQCVAFLRYRPEDANLIAEATGKGEIECKSTAEKNKAYNEKIRKLWLSLYDGTEVVVSGKIVRSTFSGNLEMQVNNLSKCRIVTDAKPTHLRDVPQQYNILQPTAVNTYEQLSLDNAQKTERKLYWTYPTVTCAMLATGNNVLTDKPVSIAFAKVIDGVVTEVLHTNINPEINVSQDLLLHIGSTNKQLLYFPTMTEIVADIYKFCHGCVMVGLQTDLIIDFLRYYGMPIGYNFDNEVRTFGDVIQQLNNATNKLYGTPNTNNIEEVLKACSLKNLVTTTVLDKATAMAQAIAYLCKN